MNKIWLIIKREYITRVKTKAFLISTLLVPLCFALILVVPILTTLVSEKEYLRIYVVDKSEKVISQLINDDNFTFIHSEDTFEDLKEKLINKDNDGILIIPEDLSSEAIEINYLSSSKLSLDQEAKLRSILRNILREIKIENSGIPVEILDSLKLDLSFTTEKLGADGREEKTSSVIGAALGYIMAFLIYMTMFIYGSFVMRGVVEEKANRLVEILISSVKPVELMIGKIVGIGAMGLTQISIWFIMKSAILFTALALLSRYNLTAKPGDIQEISGIQNSDINYKLIQEIILDFHNSFNMSLIFFFFFYFIGGYLLYGSLFAAVGSAVDQESDAHQLSFPITIPLIIPMLMLVKILQNPNGTIARFFSIFPLFSPMTMLVRLASVDVPWYELLLSMALLVFSFLLSVWVSARIYRTGILMYGKKPSFKELAKWVFYKD